MGDVRSRSVNFMSYRTVWQPLSLMASSSPSRWLATSRGTITLSTSKRLIRGRPRCADHEPDKRRLLLRDDLLDRHGVGVRAVRLPGMSRTSMTPHHPTPPPHAEPSLTTLREKVVKIGAKVVAHGRYLVFQTAKVAVPRELFGRILDRIGRLRPPDLAPC